MSAGEGAPGRGGLRKALQDNSLTLALFSLFAVCMAAQAVTGWLSYGEALAASHLPPVGFAAFLATGTLLASILTNWQAAVLQLAVLVSFSSVLRQRGAAHSRKGPYEPRDEKTAKDDTPGERHGRANPQSLRLNLRFDRRHWLRDNSLSLALFGQFVAYFVLHAWASWRAYNEEQALRHLQPEALGAYLKSSSLWFASFQTWEAEFFAIWLYILLSIFLRQKGSPESKRPDSGDDDTGETNE